MPEKEWLFVYTDEGKNSSWWLAIKSLDELMSFFREDKVLEKDKEHYLKLEKWLGEKDKNDRTKVAHSEFGHIARFLKKEFGDILDTEGAYSLMGAMKFSSMAKVLEEKGELLVNRKGGFRAARKDEKRTAFVRRKTLEFPHYLSRDIRLRKFPDGTHWYAYIGDMQVRDGDILKWDTEEGARRAAEKFAADKKREIFSPER